MKTSPLFRILFLFIYTLPLAYAAPPTLESCFSDAGTGEDTQSNNSADFIMWEDCEGSSYNSSNFKTNGASMAVTGGKCVQQSNDRSNEYVRSQQYIGSNQTIEFSFYADSSSFSNPNYGFVAASNHSVPADWGGGISDNVWTIFEDAGAAPGFIRLASDTNTNGNIFDNIINNSFRTSASFTAAQNISIYQDSTGALTMWINGTYISNASLSGYGVRHYHFHTSAANNVPMRFDNLRIFNGTACPTVTLDTSLSEVTLINLTSEGGAGQLVNLTDLQCQNAGCVIPRTLDTTPTFSVVTTKDASCRIGIVNANYSDLGPSRECSGSNVTTHTCTVITDDELHEESSLLYIGCRGTAGAENLAATIGPFKVYIGPGDYETLARTAIESAAATTLTGYSLYADQKLYARSANNSQFTGTFDRVIKYLNKIWAFNVLTGNDTAVGGFNITPALYILEFRNSTISQINNTVQQLINATK